MSPNLPPFTPHSPPPSIQRGDDSIAAADVIMLLFTLRHSSAASLSCDSFCRNRERSVAHSTSLFVADWFASAAVQGRVFTHLFARRKVLLGYYYTCLLPVENDINTDELLRLFTVV